mgnify:CR=1 FL=1
MVQWLFISLLYIAQAGLQQDPSDLVVVIQGIRNQSGALRVCLFNEEEGFPSKAERALFIKNLPISADRMELTFPGLAPGRYAVSVLHDENEDGKMSFSWIGFPKEGYACSNDAKGVLGPPQFEKASFELDFPRTTQVLTMRY